MADTKTQKHAGFTLIEVIAVLLIMGILSVVIVTRWNLRDTEQIGQIEVIKSHLRYAQSRAMSSSSNWYVYFETTPAQYTLYNQGGVLKYFPGVTEPEPDPDPDNPEPIALKSGVSLLSEETYVLFDYLGRPYPNNTGASGTQQTAVRTIITSSAGDIAIRPETGFIP